MIVYEGPSCLDGAPIVGIVTGSRGTSHNAKTGPMAQLYILRADMPPRAARQTGADASICGNCPARAGACYVQIDQGPRSVYQAYVNGRYTRVDLDRLEPFDVYLRLGAYGDPAALPPRVLLALVAKAPNWTGYTHQWRTAPVALRHLLMASVDSYEEQVEARAMGYRTFRTLLPHEAGVTGEIACPAGETHNAVRCVDCRLCNGTHDGDWRKSITIRAHGSAAVLQRYAQMRLPVVT